jgi:lipopolysaccharide export LptBFGC system permease protein LptF
MPLLLQPEAVDFWLNATAEQVQSKILLIVGVLFSTLAAAVASVAPQDDGVGFHLLSIIIFAVGFVCMTVNFLGNERAVAKIWGDR